MAKEVVYYVNKNGNYFISTNNDYYIANEILPIKYKSYLYNNNFKKYIAYIRKNDNTYIKVNPYIFQYRQ